jgi:hypothetical protein
MENAGDMIWPVLHSSLIVRRFITPPWSPRDAIADCDRVASRLRSADQAIIRSGVRLISGHAYNDREDARVKILSCRGIGGVTAAATIRESRFLTDTAVLEQLVGTYRMYRDTAVVNAVVEVAADTTASIPARIFALRSIWILRTGNYWFGYDVMTRTDPSSPTEIKNTCGSGIRVTDATAFWYEGVLPTTGFEPGLKAVAERLMKDGSQLMVIRGAAFCATLH